MHSTTKTREKIYEHFSILFLFCFILVQSQGFFFHFVENLSEESTLCQLYAKEAFCYYVFPPCKLDIYLQPLDDAKPEKLCREDCELLKHDVCRKEFFQQQTNFVISVSLLDFY